MKTTIAILVLITATSSFASFNRLWVGFKKKDVTTTVFLNGLNKTFFKDTIDVGQEKGLLSYQPYITSMKNDLPDELALVVYESEEKYKAIRSTPEGARYGTLHWDFFDKEKSKSTVSRPFEGKLAEGSAFELNPAYSEWQTGSTHVAIYSRTIDTDLNLVAKIFNDLKLNKDVKNSILLISPKWIIEYRSSIVGAKFNKLPIESHEVNKLLSTSLESIKEPVGFSEGVNFLFP